MFKSNRGQEKFRGVHIETRVLFLITWVSSVDLPSPPDRVLLPRLYNHPAGSPKLLEGVA